MTKTTRIPVSHSIGLAFTCPRSAVTGTMPGHSTAARGRPSPVFVAPLCGNGPCSLLGTKDCHFAKAAVPI